MSGFSETFSSQPGSERVSRYVATVYLWMAGGLVISAMSAAATHESPPLYALLFTANGLTVAGWLVTLSPLAIVLIFAGVVRQLSVGAARALFLLFSILIGASLASIFAAYSGASIVQAFVTAAAGYACLAFIGFTSRRDLSGIGQFMTVALVGLIIAMLINLFVRSAATDAVLACIGILIFAVLTAVDAQRIKSILQQDKSGARPDQLAILGSLTLYLDFLNLFLSLLRITGRRRGSR